MSAELPDCSPQGVAASDTQREPSKELSSHADDTCVLIAKSDSLQNDSSSSSHIPPSSQRLAGDGQDSTDLDSPAAATAAAPVPTPSGNTAPVWSPESEEQSGEANGTGGAGVPEDRQLEAVRQQMQLIAMGFGEEDAKRALAHPGNRSFEEAVAWLLDGSSVNEELPASSADHRLDVFSLAAQADREISCNHKMVFVVNMELKMGLGKIGAQVAHATLGLYKELSESPLHVESLIQWDAAGETMVVVKGESTDHLLHLARQANQQRLPCYVVQDAGRTQIAAGSVTVLSIYGPGNQVDTITAQLKLV